MKKEKIPIRTKLLFLLCVFQTLLFSEEVCFFLPPEGWQAARPQGLSEYVEIGFVGKSSESFSPSISLAKEGIDCGLKEYVQAVKEIHLAEANTQYRDLGPFAMKGGKGRLIQLSNPSTWGDLTLFQAILVKDKMAYILTASMLKQEMASLQKEVIASLQSLDVKPDLWTDLDELKQSVQTVIGEKAADTQNEQKWTALQKLIEQETKHLGAHWQYLALKETHAQIFGRTQ